MISNETVEIVKKFRDDRNWRQFHNPKDLAISINLEAAELLEIFQWSADDLECLDKLEASGTSNTKAEADAVASLRLTAEYNSFIEGRRAMTRDEFVESLRVLAASETPVAAQTLYELIWNYTVGIAPYIAFAVHYQK